MTKTVSCLWGLFHRLAKHHFCTIFNIIPTTYTFSLILMIWLTIQEVLVQMKWLWGTSRPQRSWQEQTWPSTNDLEQDLITFKWNAKEQADMEFVQKFTQPDFQAKHFTPSISPNFYSFIGKKHNKWVKMEKFTPLAKILHCRRQWRHWQIPPLLQYHHGPGIQRWNLFMPSLLEPV